MKVIVAGGRDYVNTNDSAVWLWKQLYMLQCTEVVCGMARGADMFGYDIAVKLNIPVKEFPADWNTYGKSAGYKRNELMAQYADACILFPGGKGTKHMEDLAIKHGLKVIKYEGE